VKTPHWTQFTGESTQIPLVPNPSSFFFLVPQSWVELEQIPNHT
jgi:hypothetical protein